MITTQQLTKNPFVTIWEEPNEDFDDELRNVAQIFGRHTYVAQIAFSKFPSDQLDEVLWAVLFLHSKAQADDSRSGGDEFVFIGANSDVMSNGILKVKFYFGTLEGVKLFVDYTLPEVTDDELVRTLLLERWNIEPLDDRFFYYPNDK